MMKHVTPKCACIINFVIGMLCAAWIVVHEVETTNIVGHTTPWSESRQVEATKAGNGYDTYAFAATVQSRRLAAAMNPSRPASPDKGGEVHGQDAHISGTTIASLRRLVFRM